jgi:hypothetical protein
VLLFALFVYTAVVVFGSAASHNAMHGPVVHTRLYKFPLETPVWDENNTTPTHYLSFAFVKLLVLHQRRNQHSQASLRAHGEARRILRVHGRGDWNLIRKGLGMRATLTIFVVQI